MYRWDYSQRYVHVVSFSKELEEIRVVEVFLGSRIEEVLGTSLIRAYGDSV